MTGIAIPHDTLLLVADGEKMMFLRNHGNGAQPEFALETRQDRPDLSDSEGKTDTATGGGDQEYHKDEENRFAAHLADQLRMRALAHDFEALIIVAPPRTLGELRKNLHGEVEKRIIMELAKEMTDRPIPDITAMLMTRSGTTD
ncbi:host attachment family protein [Sphingorhabdus sp.]|uniref:host attachment family protein n=1 Tax=Sphingorhabdus sp. TaxID=1902408 RepID=UPI00391AC2E3